MSSEVADEFKSCLAKVGGFIEGAFVRIGLDIGRRLGLFTAISSFKEPQTSQQIADHLHLKERYVREWLGAMVNAGIVSLDTSEEKYYITEPMSRVLGSSIIHWSQAVTDLEVTEDLVECFKLSGPRGLPYSRYSNFISWQEGLTSRKLEKHVATDLVDSVLGLKEKLESGITMCDMGCGCGLVSRLLAKAFPKSTFYGFDMSEISVNRAKTYAESEGVIENCKFFVHNAEKLPEDWSGRFDVVTAFDSVHDQARPDLGLQECYRILKADGELLVLDVKAHTRHGDNLHEKEFKILDPAFTPTTLYTVSLLHCMPVSLYFEGGLGLGAVWGKEQAVEMLQRTGFHVLDVKEVEYYTTNLLYICKK